MKKVYEKAEVKVYEMELESSVLDMITLSDGTKADEKFMEDHEDA